MGYLEKVLQAEERVICRAHVHWAVFIWPVILLGLAAAIALTATSYPESSTNPEEQTLLNYFALRYALYGAAVFVGLFGLRSLVNALIEKLCTELVVTDRRVIAKTGFIRRQTWEINNGKVEGVQVNQSILGRLLGYGSVVVKGTGGGFTPMQNIDDPLTFRSHVTAPATPHPPEDGVAPT